MSLGLGITADVFAGSRRAARLPLGFMGGTARPQHAPRGLAFGHNKQATDLRALIATREISADLRITTDEGDVVTISSQSELEVTYASLRHRNKGPDGAFSAQAELREISLDRNVTLTVVGDLNEQELADIRRLMDRLGPTLSGFRPGQGETLALRIDGSEFESLAGFELNVEKSISITRIHVRHRATPDAPEIPKPEPQRMPAVQPGLDDAPSLASLIKPEAAPMPVIEVPVGDDDPQPVVPSMIAFSEPALVGDKQASDGLVRVMLEAAGR